MAKDTVLQHEDSLSEMLKKAILFGLNDEGVDIDTLDDGTQEGIASVVNMAAQEEK